MTKGRAYPEYKATGLKWLGEVPASWGVVPLWTLYSRGKSTNFPDEELLSVYRDHGVVPKSSRGDNFNKPSEDLSSYQLVKPGDMVINKMKAWQGSVAISRHRGIVSPAYFVYAGHHGMDDRYLHYLLRSERYITGYLSLSKGIRINQWDLDPTYHSRMPVLVPSLQEQRAIVNLLDRETAQIDELIGKQERLIEMLAEKRQAVITQAVTRGLDPIAPTKPAGIPWLGQIPAHWQVSPVGSCAVLIQTGPFGSQIHAEDYVAGGTPLINPSHLVEGRIAPNLEVAVSDDKAQELRRHALRTGDVVVARRGELGRNAVSTEQDEGFLCGTGSLLVRLQTNAYLPEYFSLVFGGQHTRDRLSLQSIGATMDNLNAGLIARLRLVRPPITEQESILQWLSETTDVLDKTTRKAVRSIDLLRERRSALISAAVTGKIDVREGAA
ncbi:restriction endonuclease subunit S [Arthrobacter sp. NPDC056493]|uniref:restriction endonuclease subunit S n=1 Tax=Arthrobacter sp. NPDC056493 TaxID=3345839 RepID=UPI00366CF3E8